MDRQKNRGQDGAGIAIISEKEQKIFVDRDLSPDALLARGMQMQAGTILLGHLRYATSGKNELTQCQPALYEAEGYNQTFALVGNFNLTNAAEILGEHSTLNDTFAILKTLSESHTHSPLSTLKKAAPFWDGGYVLCQAYANGDALICRDPYGIRPGFYFQNDELFAVASERSALVDTFDAKEEDVHPIPPGYALLFSKSGKVKIASFYKGAGHKECLFERIYFSKATDSDIYQERKELGRQLARRVWDSIGGDLAHTIFTYVPNSSQVAFLGLVEQIAALQREEIEKKCLEKAPLEEICSLLRKQVRSETLIIKNQKMRTFIASDEIRKERVPQLYEVTPNIVTNADTLVVIDDSIVRGVTLKEILMKKLISLNPKKIIIVSSSPPVYFPDCYGIDMSQIGRFVAFQAAVELYKEKEGQNPTDLDQIYFSSTLEEIERKVAQLILPQNTTWKGEVAVIYQSIEGLHSAMPSFQGDWVFTGSYPTSGGFKVLQKSFRNWINKDESRSY